MFVLGLEELLFMINEFLVSKLIFCMVKLSFERKKEIMCLKIKKLYFFI